MTAFPPHARWLPCSCPQVTNGFGQRIPYADPGCPRHGTRGHPIQLQRPQRVPLWKIATVKALETSCDRLHFITHHRPWLWLRLPRGVSVHCPLADLSERLDRRWKTGVWQ